MATGGTTFDVFLTHDWQTDELGRNNHARVAVINRHLQQRGFVTWFDEDRMTGLIRHQMTQGINNAKGVIVFLTKAYMWKVNASSTERRNDNCKYELNYAFDHESVEIFVVTMDKTMSNPRNWKDELKGMLGRYLFVDMCGDFDDENYLRRKIDGLVGHLSKAGIHPSCRSTSQSHTALDNSEPKRECPACKAQFELAGSGDFLFTCVECKYEFCLGCYKEFKRDGACQVHASCIGKGLHAHHPRDCLYYLRDMEVKQLEMLLNNHNIHWIRDYPPEMIEMGEKVCGVALWDGGRKDKPCGNKAPLRMAGMCERHYKEYCVGLINNNGIDPVEVFDISIMRNVLRRNFRQDLPKNNGETDPSYRTRLREYVKKEVPLPVRAERRSAPIRWNECSAPPPPVGADAVAAVDGKVRDPRPEVVGGVAVAADSAAVAAATAMFLRLWGPTVDKS